MERPSEAPRPTQFPPELEILGRDAVEEHRVVGEKLFWRTSVAGDLAMARWQVEDRCLEKIAAVEGTRPSVTPVKEAYRRKRRAWEKEGRARGTAISQEKRLGRLRRKADLVTDVGAGEPDIVEDGQERFREGNRGVGETIVASMAEASRLRDEAEATTRLARAEREAVKFREVLAEQVRKLPEHIRERLGLKDVVDALNLIHRTQEQLPRYYAGLVAAATRVIREAGEDRPLGEGVFEEAKVLEKVQEATDLVWAKSARKLDRSVESAILGREGGFAAKVLGDQQRRDIAIRHESARAFEIVGETLVITPEAVTRAADQIRVLIENPGRGRRPLGDELLTTEGLRRDRESRLKELLDPLRRLVYSRFARRSVEEALGCQVIATGTGKERKTDFQPLPPEEQPTATPLYANLVRYEAIDMELRRTLHNTEPTDIEGVQTLVKALREVDQLRQAILKNADARLNGLFVADGVRSGALKVALAETGVKAVEGAIVAGFVYWATYRWGVTPKLEEAEFIRAEAQRILAAPDQLADLWRMIENLAPGLDLTELRSTISAHSSEFAKAAASGTADRITEITSLLNKVIHLEKLVEMGRMGRAAELVEEAARTSGVAQIIRLAGAAGGLAAGAASMQEAVRKAATAPVRGARNFIRGRIGPIL